MYSSLQHQRDAYRDNKETFIFAIFRFTIQRNINCQLSHLDCYVFREYLRMNITKHIKDAKVNLHGKKFGIKDWLF